MKITDKEIESVSALDPFKRYQYFIKRIADFEEVWTIKNEAGDFALSNLDDHTLVSLWSAEVFVKNNLGEGWAKCIPHKLDLDELEEQLLSIISDNSYLINVFPVNGKSGFVVSEEEFIRDLNDELEQYE